MRLAASARLKELMAWYFADLAAAGQDSGERVAWCTSAGPAEILRAFGYKVYFPENHGAVLGASRQANDCIPHAAAAGYSSQICSYLTSDIGAHLRGASPLAAYGDLPPRPDLLVACDNQCREVEEWFGYYARACGVPLHVVRTAKFLGDVEPHHLAFLERELEMLLERLEHLTGTRRDRERLAETVLWSARACRGWKRCLDLAAVRPAPFTFFDGTIHMAPVVMMRGLPAAAAYYDELAAELQTHVRDGVAAVQGERHRLYWEGMPIWGRLRALSEQLAGLRAAVVASTYCNSWTYEAFDESTPLASLARGYSEVFINRSEAVKEAELARLCRAFAVDGIVYHDAKTCPYNSNTHFALPERLYSRTGIPYVVVEGDLNDLRCFSDEQAQIKFETFVEQLEQRR